MDINIEPITMKNSSKRIHKKVNISSKEQQELTIKYNIDIWEQITNRKYIKKPNKIREGVLEIIKGRFTEMGYA